MEQKFLDSEGVKHLWSKVNMQDYPNNEVLVGIINAIDDTKANKEDILKSIPFNKIFIGEEEWIGYYNIENADFKFIPGKAYTIIWDDVEYPNLICENWEDEYYGVGDMWGSSNTYPFGISTSTTYENRVMIYVYGEENPIEHSFYIYPVDETKADKSELFSGSWNDLTNKPTQGIPSEDITIKWSEDENSYYFNLPSNFYFSGENIYEATLQLENSYSYIYGNITIVGQEYAGGNSIKFTITFNSNNNTQYFESDLSAGDIFISKSNTNIELDNAILIIYSGEVLSDYIIPDTIARILDLTTTLTEAKSYTDTAVADLVNSAPETLDTLGELAAAFEENADMVATLDAAVTNKAEQADLENLAELVDINAISITSLQNELFNLIYPIGAIYLSATEVSPSTLFGGTWEQIKDTFLLAAGDIYNNEETGGEATHTLTIAEMPSHSHKLKTDIDSADYNETWPEYYEYNEGWIQGPNSTTETPPTHTTSTGEGEAHNNMPPYLTVYMWKRTA